MCAVLALKMTGIILALTLAAVLPGMLDPVGAVLSNGVGEKARPVVFASRGRVLALDALGHALFHAPVYTLADIGGGPGVFKARRLARTGISFLRQDGDRIRRSAGKVEAHV